MDDEEFEKRLNKEKSFINYSKNHTAELEKQLEEQREEHKTRDEIEKRKEDIIKSRSEDSDEILTGSDSSSSGIFGALPDIILSLVSVAIVLSVGFIVLDELKSAVGEEQYSQFNSSGMLNTLNVMGSWIPIIVIVSITFMVLSFFRIRD